MLGMIWESGGSVLDTLGAYCRGSHEPPATGEYSLGTPVTRVRREKLALGTHQRNQGSPEV